MKNYNKIYMKSGLRELFRYHPAKWLIIIAYIALSLYLWHNRGALITLVSGFPYFDLLEKLLETLLIALFALGLLAVLAAIGRPFGSYFIHRRLRQIKLENDLGQQPILVSRRKDKHKAHGVIFEFVNFGITPEQFDNVLPALQQCLRAKVRCYDLSKKADRTLVYATPLKYDKPNIITDNSNYLTKGLINLLVVGKTGSGKSVALSVILSSLAKHNKDLHITICDYKKSSFAHFDDTPNFYGYETAPDGISVFYREFQERLEANDEKRNSEKRVLCIDEYGAMIAAQDKKKADELKTMVANMLFMGRSLGIIVIIGVQRADAEHFKAGARDQFKAILAMGNISKEQKQMLFSEHKDKLSANNKIGEGYLYIDGNSELERVKVIPGDEAERNGIIRKAMES